MKQKASRDVYARLGVRRLINAYGTLTRLGGNRMAPEVTAAMVEASKHYVDLDELLAKSGGYVSRMLGVEAAYVTSGAAAGLVLCTAACVAGTDRSRMERLPDTRGMPNRVAIHRAHRNGYDQAIRQVGVELAEFGSAEETHDWQLEAAIDEGTAAVAYFVAFEPVEFAKGGCLPIEKVIEIAHGRGVPVIVDAAAEVPPPENLHRFNDLGADLVVLSGGKEIAGPQSSGLVCGRRDLVEACAMNANPNYGIGRPMKAGKEEIVGLVRALELYLEEDHAAKEGRREEAVAHLVATLGALEGVRAKRVCPVPPGINPVTIPRAYVEWDEASLGVTADEARERLLEGDPAVAVHAMPGRLVLNPQTLAPGEEKTVAERIAAVLGR